VINTARNIKIPIGIVNVVIISPVEDREEIESGCGLIAKLRKC